MKKLTEQQPIVVRGVVTVIAVLSIFVLHGCATVQPNVAEICSVYSGSNYLLITGNVLTPEGVLEGGSVLVTPDGRIAKVGLDVPENTKGLNPTKIACPTCVISPGLINAHDHIDYDQNIPNPGYWGDERYDHRNQWRKGLDGHTQIPYTIGTYKELPWSELRQLMAGTTSIAGSGGCKGLLRNLDVDCHLLMEGIKADYAVNKVFPLGDTDGIVHTDCKYDNHDDPKIVLNEHQCYLPHVAEGVNAGAKNEITCLNGFNLITDKGAFIHTVGSGIEEANLLKEKGVSVIWSPRSNIALYGNTAPVLIYKKLRLNIALGTDWTPTGSINLLRELKCADEFNKTYLANTFSDYDLWMMVTANPADALHLSSQIGRLREKLVADIAIFKASKVGANYHRAVIDANVDDVMLVLRGGKPLFGNADIMHGIVPASKFEKKDCEDIDVLGVKKSVCLKQEIGVVFQSLKKDNEKSYDLFFKDTPDKEPTCKPARIRVQDEKHPYTGIPTADDLDGDGIPNDKDNCPTIFNPVRPMETNQLPVCNY